MVTMPDILQVNFCPEEGQEFTFIRCAVTCHGTFRELYGVRVAVVDVVGRWSPPPFSWALTFRPARLRLRL